METMYDRLGDLLNETLETGRVKFVKKTAEQNKSNAEYTVKPEQNVNTETDIKSENKIRFKGKITKEIIAACKVLDITTSATLKDVKNAYKSKLKYFHPDRHNGNKILQKVASDKTRQIVAAYNLIMDSIVQ